MDILKDILETRQPLVNRDSVDDENSLMSMVKGALHDALLQNPEDDILLDQVCFPWENEKSTLDFELPKEDFELPEGDFELLEGDFELLEEDFELPEEDFRLSEEEDYEGSNDEIPDVENIGVGVEKSLTFKETLLHILTIVKKITLLLKRDPIYSLIEELLDYIGYKEDEKKESKKFRKKVTNKRIKIDFQKSFDKYKAIEAKRTLGESSENLLKAKIGLLLIEVLFMCKSGEYLLAIHRLDNIFKIPEKRKQLTCLKNFKDMYFFLALASQLKVEINNKISEN